MKNLNAAISERALFLRIDRALKREDGFQRLRRIRGERVISEFGYFAIWDYRRNNPIAQWVCLEKLGRELGVLGEHQNVIWEN